MRIAICLLTCLLSFGCRPWTTGGEAAAPAPATTQTIDERIAQYDTVRLTTDISTLTESQRKMISLLIDAAKEMDQLFWRQSFVDRRNVQVEKLSAPQRRYLEMNYGPWDRLDGNESFLPGIGPKPLGAAFYPTDMTKEEFEASLAANPEKAAGLKSEYTVVLRDGLGELISRPYRLHYGDGLDRAAAKLSAAAELAQDAGFKKYLELRAKALVTDNYQPSDFAWMESKTNRIDCVIGPIEHYEDRLFNYKTAFEAYVLVKDVEWSQRLDRYRELLPGLQAGLPVPDEYKKEDPGSNSDLNAYDVVYYAGDCNAGSKTIAINLPNDEEVQIKAGTRRLQLKNAIRAKYDRILEPIADVVIHESQRQHITFDAFFGNIMFHEVAHGLGIKNTIDGSGTVRQALKDEYSALEEGKADVLGLYMISKLREEGHLEEGELMDNYVTFLAGIFRSVRFGTSSAHGRANVLRFNFFRDMGAFVRGDDGTYQVDAEAMGRAVAALSERILKLQGDGDYEGAQKFVAETGQADDILKADLERIADAKIPVDIVFEQGVDVLGL
ncbi:MAG: Zn-dependent hydrolase [Planctomycetota bacterium]